MNPEAMAAHNVSPLDLKRAIQAANVRQTAGDFRAAIGSFGSRPANRSRTPGN